MFKKMISIIDYGLGNIQAFKNIYDRLNIPCTFASSIEDNKLSTKLILPGVGSFDWAMSRLNESGLIESINDEVVNNKKPIYNKKGKVMKGPKYFKPDLSKFVAWSKIIIIGFCWELLQGY